MSAVDIALPRIKGEESYRGRIYTDSEGKATIGYGFNLTAGISEFSANALLVAQLEEIDHALNAYSVYGNLDAIRQSVLIDIAFNAGVEGLLKFPRMLAALAAKDWATAANECRVTNPELAGRYERLARILLTGETA
jgi:lysozyme